MKTISLFIMSLSAFLFCLPVAAFSHPHILDVARGEEVTFSELLDQLAAVDLVFIGELHDRVGHHQMQLEVIKGLQEREIPVAVGLEMFQEDYQGALDRWISQELSESGFMMIFNQNWSMWPKYRPIFLYARELQVPMIALNISRDVTRRVAREGFDSLTDAQRKGLEGVACRVEPAYEDFIRRALGGHGHNQPNFIYFCEAQMLWDAAMARNLVAFTEKFPERKVVVLAGSGHSWKYGIPSQVTEIRDLSYKVILPEVAGRIDRTNATPNDVDYLWLDFGEDGWTLPRQASQ